MKPYWDNGVVQLYQADARELPLADASVHCIVTSPPYFGLRVYQDNDDRGIGLEKSIEEYLDNLLAVFRECRRVLRDDGIMWVNIGDSYGRNPAKGQHKPGDSGKEAHVYDRGGGRASSTFGEDGNRLLIPERLALALQADGWTARDAPIWAKKSAMPESVNGWRWERCRVKDSNGRIPRHGIARGNGHVDESNVAERDDGAQWSPCPGCAKCADDDGLVLRKGSWRTTQAHEVILMMTKGMGYYADGEAVKTATSQGTMERFGANNQRASAYDEYFQERDGGKHIGQLGISVSLNGANRRSVWNDIRPEPYGGTNCPNCGEMFKSKVYKRFPNRYICRDCEYVIILSANKTLDDCPECGGDMSKERLCINCEVPLLSHFATFPSDLPRICIQASTSERGCCSKCGSQWARVVETTFTPQTDVSLEHGIKDPAGVDSSSGWGGMPRGTIATNTLGWRATCNCGEIPVAPLVLDPFCGTATTMLAAQRLGRRAVGVDLSEAYLKQAVKRLEAVPLPLHA